jgi:hypothetical protein
VMEAVPVQRGELSAFCWLSRVISSSLMTTNRTKRAFRRQLVMLQLHEQSGDQDTLER